MDRIEFVYSLNRYLIDFKVESPEIATAELSKVSEDDQPFIREMYC